MVGPVGSVEQAGRRCPALGQQVLWTRDALLLQTGEDLVDDCRILDAGDDFDSAAAGTAVCMSMLNTRLRRCAQVMAA